MRKLTFPGTMAAVAALLVLSLLAGGCARDKTDKLLDSMEDMVEEAERIAEQDTVVASDMQRLQEKNVQMQKQVEDLKSSGQKPTPAQEKRAQELAERMMKAGMTMAAKMMQSAPTP